MPLPYAPLDPTFHEMPTRQLGPLTRIVAELLWTDKEVMKHHKDVLKKDVFSREKNTRCEMSETLFCRGLTFTTKAQRYASLLLCVCAAAEMKT